MKIFKPFLLLVTALILCSNYVYADSVDMSDSNTSIEEMILSKTMLDSGEISTSQFTEVFLSLLETAERNQENNPNEQTKTLTESLKIMFLGSNIAENIANNNFFLSVLYYFEGNIDKAHELINEVTESKENAKEKAHKFNQYANICLRNNDIEKTIEYAKKSLETDPHNGMAFLLLGKAYASFKRCGDNEVSKRSVYWVAVDQMLKVKQFDKQLAPEAEKYINRYMQQFPNKSDALYLNLTDGKTYKVICGPINESTIVRTQ